MKKDFADYLELAVNAWDAQYGHHYGPMRRLRLATATVFFWGEETAKANADRTVKSARRTKRARKAKP